MKPKRAKNPLETPLIAEEQALEDSLDATNMVHASAATLVAVSKGLKELRERRARGGARPGAGRKRKSYVPTMLNLSPKARTNLEKLAATEAGGMSAVVNRLLET